jgi:hypothetical protein
MPVQAHAQSRSIRLRAASLGEAACCAQDDRFLVTYLCAIISSGAECETIRVVEKPGGPIEVLTILAVVVAQPFARNAKGWAASPMGDFIWMGQPAGSSKFDPWTGVFVDWKIPARMGPCNWVMAANRAMSTSQATPINSGSRMFTSCGTAPRLENGIHQLLPGRNS